MVFSPWLSSVLKERLEVKSYLVHRSDRQIGPKSFMANVWWTGGAGKTEVEHLHQLGHQPPAMLGVHQAVHWRLFYVANKKIKL